MYDELGGAPKVNAFRSSFQGGPLDPFLTGQVSMKIDTTWSLQQMINWKPNMDFITSPAPIPADRFAAGEKPITWAGGFSFVIPTTAQQSDGAFKLMQFLTSRECYRFLQQANREAMAAEGRLYLPEPHPNRKYFEEIEREWVSDDPTVPIRIKEAYAVIKQMLPNSKVRPPSPIGQVLWNQHVRAMDVVINHTYANQFPDKDEEVRHAAIHDAPRCAGAARHVSGAPAATHRELDDVLRRLWRFDRGHCDRNVRCVQTTPPHAWLSPARGRGGTHIRQPVDHRPRSA